jgi:TRAP-type mannitol/chloroaromatic compound transport system substrate-binding protein
MLTRALALFAPMFFLGPASVGAETAPVVLVTPIVYGTHMPGLGDSATKLAKLIKDRSGGTLQLDLKQPGDGTTPDEILDKVSDGKVDAGFSTPSFWTAELPAAALFAGYPFGPDGKTYLDWFDNGDGRSLYQEMYDHAGMKVHVMPCAFGGAESGGWFAKEIKSKDDLKGLRMRIFGLGARVMAEAGATTVVLPGGKIESAFDKKEIDAAELYTPAVDIDEGLKDKAKLIYIPGWHQPETVLEFIVNKDHWEGLTDEQRSLIDGACKTLLQESLAGSSRLQAEALSELSAKDGVRILTWPDDVLAALKEAWAKVAKDEGDRDYFFRFVLDDIDKFRAEAEGQTPPSSAPAQTAQP